MATVHGNYMVSLKRKWGSMIAATKNRRVLTHPANVMDKN